MGGTRHFTDATKEEILKLIADEGQPQDIEDQWNSFPGLQNIFDNLDDLDNVTYYGYVVDKTRNDWRVSVEGFEAHGLTADQVLDLKSIFASADENDHTKHDDGTYSLRCWWD